MDLSMGQASLVSGVPVVIENYFGMDGAHTLNTLLARALVYCVVPALTHSLQLFLNQWLPLCWWFPLQTCTEGPSMSIRKGGLLGSFRPLHGTGASPREWPSSRIRLRCLLVRTSCGLKKRESHNPSLERRRACGGRIGRRREGRDSPVCGLRG